MAFEQQNCTVTGLGMLFAIGFLNQYTRPSPPSTPSETMAAMSTGAGAASLPAIGTVTD